MHVSMYSAVDYVREFQFGWRKWERGDIDGTNSTWCCDSNTDCVDDAPDQGDKVSGDPDSTNSGCYGTGTLRNTGAGDGADTEECRSSIWYAQDTDSTACGNAGNTWLSNGAGTYSDCCGDDSGEDFEQTESAGRTCCYNAAVLNDNTASSSILCDNGQLWDCNNQISSITDNVETNNVTCSYNGGKYCNQSNTWISTIPDTCPCTTGTTCASGYCINGLCRSGCSASYDGQECSDDGNTYNGASNGVCAQTNGAASWECDKDEVGVSGSDYFNDCYEVDAGAPSSVYACDTDISSGYTANGMCTYSTGGAADGTVNCDITDEVCFDDTDYICCWCTGI